MQFYTGATERAMVRASRSFTPGNLMASDWVKIATVSTGFEADTARATLEDAGIPVLVRGNQAGIFGGGFQGLVIGGIDIFVPTDAVPRARELVVDDDEEENP